MTDCAAGDVYTQGEAKEVNAKVLLCLLAVRKKDLNLEGERTQTRIFDFTTQYESDRSEQCFR